MILKEALSTLLDEKEGLIVASTGKISRTLFDLRVERNEPTDDFYMMGSMGCALGIGLGLALGTKKQVIVLTGDGALLMKLGSIATILDKLPKNLLVVVLNNNCHNSTGGQPTAFNKIRPLINEHFLVMDIEPDFNEVGRPTITPPEMTKKFREKVCSNIQRCPSKSNDRACRGDVEESTGV